MPNVPKTALAQMVGDVISTSTGIGVSNICDHDDADDKQFQGAVSIVGPDQNIYPRYLTLYENGILQFSKLNQVSGFLVAYKGSVFTWKKHGTINVRETPKYYILAP